MVEKILVRPTSSTHLPHHISFRTRDSQNFLEMNLPKVKKSKSASFQLGCIEPGLASTIQDLLDFPCRSDETVKEIIRGIRVHFHR